MNEQETERIIQELCDYKNIECVKEKRKTLLRIIACLTKECTELESMESNESNESKPQYQTVIRDNENEDSDSDTEVSKSTEEQMIDSSIEIAATIVRQLKASRASKNDVVAAVAELVRLKKIKEDMIKRKYNKNEDMIKRKYNENKVADITKSAEEQMIDDRIENAANNVRTLKCKKAPKDDVQAAIDELIRLKQIKEDMKTNPPKYNVTDYLL